MGGKREEMFGLVLVILKIIRPNMEVFGPLGSLMSLQPKMFKEMGLRSNKVQESCLRPNKTHETKVRHFRSNKAHKMSYGPKGYSLMHVDPIRAHIKILSPK